MKIKEKQFNVEKLKKYLNIIKKDNSIQFVSNGNLQSVNNLNLILIGKMAMLSEIERIVSFINDDN